MVNSHSEKAGEGNPRKKVMICSPFRGDIVNNIAFARQVCKFASDQGLNPFAPHLHFSRFLNEHDPTDRALGMHLGLEWGKLADEVWFCFKVRAGTDGLPRPSDIRPHYTPGMSQELTVYFRTGQRIKEVFFTEDCNFMYEMQIWPKEEDDNPTSG